MGYLCKRNIVKKIYTQNVDGLELKAGVPINKMVFAHGKITEAACPSCGREYDINVLKNEYVMKDKIMYCESCKTPIKLRVSGRAEARIPILLQVRNLINSRSRFLRPRMRPHQSS
jgi:NAD-dependent SIR2 family protein deacetylase